MSTTTFKPLTKRIRLQECKGEYLSRTGQRITNDEIAKVCFHGSRLKPLNRRSLLTQWNAGERMARLDEKTLAGIVDALGCKVKDLTGE